jgi:glutathione S-transferase
MKLIGMFDSPFVRRVAVSMKLLAIPFEHLNWSVGAQFDEIRCYSPLGRVPTLVLDDGEALTESAAILDYLDTLVGPDRALVPAGGEARREVLQRVALAIGAAEKARDQVYERVFRPPAKRHAPWIERCALQMHGALGEAERRSALTGEGGVVPGRLTQAEITLTCAWTFASDAVVLDPARYPVVAALAARCELLPEFVATRMAFSPPQ